MVQPIVPCCVKRLPLSLAVLFCFSLPVFGQSPTVRTDLKHDVSPPLRDLAKTAPPLTAGPLEADDLRAIPLPSGFKPANQPDTVLQTTTTEAPTPLGPTVGLNFEGQGNGFPNYSVLAAPPDTNGAVGKTQYVQW